jgi:predicted O-methyltransferase YrrM
MAIRFRHLRTVSRTVFAAYQAKRRHVLQLVGRMPRLDQLRRELGLTSVNLEAGDGEHLLFHAFRPGYLGISALEADTIRRAQRGLDTLPDRLQPELASRRWLDDDGGDVDALLRKSHVDFPAIQNPRELRPFLELVAQHPPRVVVEIGTAAGGVFHALAQLASQDALLASIDAPVESYGGGAGEMDRAAASMLEAMTGPLQRVRLIRDRSFHYSSLLELKQFLGDQPIDLLFIDGDHSYGGVHADFAMYAPLVRPGGLIALHDICTTPDNSGRGFDVAMFWGELRARHQTREFIDGDAVPGLIAQDGVRLEDRRPMAFGIGVVYASGSA